MDVKVEKGGYVLGPTGLPQRVGGLEELLQNAAMRIALRRGAFPYDREAGSTFWQWDPAQEHALERAAAVANEALEGLPGVWAASAREVEGGAVFAIRTPLGEGEVTVWKAIQPS